MPRTKTEELTKTQRTRFGNLFEALAMWVISRNPDDYSISRPSDGLYTSDVCSQHIEFAKGSVTYTVVLTCRRNDLD